ncbi:hypothetical protein FNV43_RR21299 [Rhamnella rubrinervis]|uniref:Uncharacterized protein n=1 Tax=Rhamnella rubrinervis TaxID=2594499 RepID=A0A8K0GRB2_9ROSA|nr:hypothetical protein FNV43_RR21299 [Rhamnella rubrinervis]
MYDRGLPDHFDATKPLLVHFATLRPNPILPSLHHLQPTFIPPQAQSISILISLEIFKFCFIQKCRRETFEPFLEYFGRSASPTPSPSSASSAVRIVEPNQVAEQNPIPCVEPNVCRVGPNENRPISAFQHPIMIKTDIPSIFKPEDMPYLKKRYSFPENAVLSAPRDGERADSVRDGWVCFYEIAFKLGLRLPFHRIINMVLKYFNLARHRC